MIEEIVEKSATIYKSKSGKLYIVIGSRKIRCEGKTELRQKIGEFIRGL